MPIPQPEQAPKVAAELGVILAVEGAFAPFIGVAESAAMAPFLLSSLVRLTQAGTTGAAVATTDKLIEEGEFPSKEELLENGLTWMAIDAALQAFHVGVGTTYDFGKAVNNIAKSEKIPRTKVLSNLWDATVNYVKSKFGRTINPSDITVEDTAILINKAKTAEEQGLGKVIEVEPIKPKEEVVKPAEISTEKPKNEVIESKEVKKTEKPISEEKIPSVINTEKSSQEFPKNEPKFDFRYGQMYFPSGVVGDYVKDPQVRSALKEVLDYPVRLVHEYFMEDFGVTYNGKYYRNQPLHINKNLETNPEKLRKIILEEALHLIQDKKLRLKKENFLLPYDEQPHEITAKKFSEWANEKEKSLETKEIEEPFKNGEEEITQELKSLESTSEELDVLPEEKPLTKKVKSRLPQAKIKGVNLQGKQQAKKRSEIIKKFRKAFKDPIRLGKISQRRALGIHKMWPKVTRLLKDNDIETAAHEIGHNLHTILYGGNATTPKTQRANVVKALTPYLSELEPFGLYEPYTLEGFAEFTRMYVTNPQGAKDLAPNFYTKFESDLDAQHPELKNALLEARDYYETYLQGTPQSRIRAHTSYAEDKGKLRNIVDSIKDNLNLEKLYTDYLDDVYPAKKLVSELFDVPISEVENVKDEKNIYRALRILKGAVGKGDVFILHETFDPKTLDKINGSLKDIIDQLPDEESYKEFNDYLIARRSKELHRRGLETGINPGDAINVEVELRAKYEKLAKELDHYNDTLLQYAVKSGLLSGQQYKAIKQNNLLYTPFQRDMGEGKGTGGVSGKIQAKQPIKRIKGSTREIIAPLESIIKNTYSIILNSEKNLVGQTLAKISTMKDAGGYVERVPTPIKLKGKIEKEQIAKELAKRFEQQGLDDLIDYDANGKPVLRPDIEDAIPEVFLQFGAGKYPAGENIVTVYFDGKPVYYEVSPDIFKMWNQQITPYIASTLTKILRIPARTLRAGAILNFKFMLKNIARDTWGSWLFTRYGKSVKDPFGLFIDTIFSPLAMTAVAAKKSALYVEFLKAGGGMSTMQAMDRNTVVKKLDEIKNGIKPHQIIKWLRKIAEVTEEANRLSEFKKGLEVEGSTRLGKEIAAFAARDLSVDFAKMGLQSKALNQIIPFFNATLQGGDKLLRSLTDSKARKDFLPRVLGFIVIPSLIFAWLNKDDQNVSEFPAYERDFNFITKIGDTYLKIPVPFETGVIAHGLTQRMFDHFIRKDPEAFERIFLSIKDAMLPSYIPIAGLPFVEAYTNKSFFTGGRIIPADKERKVSELQYKDSTSQTARLLGRAISYMAGEDTRSKFASPAIIDHFITSWTGGLGKIAIEISDASLKSAGLGEQIPGPERTITETLGFDAFITRYPKASTRSIEKFYDNYADSVARKQSSDFRKKEKGETPFKKKAKEPVLKSNPHWDYWLMQDAYKAIQLCQKEINNIYIDPSLNPKEKKELIDVLYLSKIAAAKAANDEYRDWNSTKDKY